MGKAKQLTDKFQTDEVVSNKDFDLDFLDRMDGEVFRFKGRFTKKGLKQSLLSPGSFKDPKQQQKMVAHDLETFLGNVASLASAAGQKKTSSLILKAMQAVDTEVK